MLRRYILFQIPGWLGLLAVLGVLQVWAGVPLEVNLVIAVIWLVKDVVLYPFVKHSYDPDPPSAQDRLLGRSVVAEQELGPAGFVRLDGELWQAHLAEGSSPIEPGTRARVVEVRGLTLIVSPEPKEGSTTDFG